MKVVVAPNAFKGCLSAAAVAQALALGVRRAMPGAEVVLLPLADGGEGTVDLLLAARGGERISALACDARGRMIEAFFGVLADGTAVVEAAAATGLARLSPAERDPLTATSRGTGELILAALDRGCRRILLGLGGTATCDAGAGALTALGVRFLDPGDRELPPGGAALQGLDRIACSGLDPRLVDTSVDILCDVDALLLGPGGASQGFAPQKGADPAAVDALESALARFAGVIGQGVAELPGAGAAGGMGAGISALLPRAKLWEGAPFLLAAAGLEAELAGADLILTGEGRLDAQTAQGKAVLAVARAARQAHVPAVAVVGSLGEGWEAMLSEGITEAWSLVGDGVDEARAMQEAPYLLEAAGERVVRRILGSLS